MPRYPQTESSSGTLRLRRPAGFSTTEILVVVAIVGILAAASVPSIMNTLAVRDLENATREIQTFLQQAKLQAVGSRLPYRVRFFRLGGETWSYKLERDQEDGTWASSQGWPTKTIPGTFNVTISLPLDPVSGDPVAVFSGLGTFPQFAVTRNSVTLQSPKLKSKGVDDCCVLSIFMGGSIHFDKAKSD